MDVPDTPTSPGQTPGASSPGGPPMRPDLPPRWPSVVRTELVRRHAGLLESVGDLPAERVLDLSLPSGRHLLAGLLAGVIGGTRASGAGDTDATPGFDVVVSVAGLTRFPDLGAAVTTTTSLLSPTGQLLVLEPDHRPGITGLAVSSVGALLPPARGVHLARDVPVTVRAAGLTITDIRRFTLPTLVWPLRNFVMLRAVRITADGGVDDGERGGADDAAAQSLDTGGTA